MSAVLSAGHRFTVGFLGLCCALGLLNVARGLLTGTQSGMLFALAQTVFSLFTGAAAWNIFQWKKIGWYLGFFVVLQWFSSMVNFRGGVGWFTIVLTFPIVAVAIWLYLPVVRARFEIKKVFG
jgi:hypothetical protein